VYGTIAVAALANVLMSALLDVPGRIIGASFLAIVLAETADTEVYQRLLRYPWLVRVAGSNAISVPLDTVLFSLVAFARVLPPWEIASLVFGKSSPSTPLGRSRPCGKTGALFGRPASRRRKAEEIQNSKFKIHKLGVRN
jgi:hypothetical protein